LNQQCIGHPQTHLGCDLHHRLHHIALAATCTIDFTISSWLRLVPLTDFTISLDITLAAACTTDFTISPWLRDLYHRLHHNALAATCTADFTISLWLRIVPQTSPYRPGCGLYRPAVAAIEMTDFEHRTMLLKNSIFSIQNSR
jgi:hypothetical protein